MKDLAKSLLQFVGMFIILIIGIPFIILGMLYEIIKTGFNKGRDLIITFFMSVK